MISTSQQPCAILCLRTAHGTRRILEDYEKKSKVFMEPEGILGAKINGGKNILPKELLPEMEGIKKLMKKDGDLQCEEDLAQVACSLPFRRCKVFQQFQPLFLFWDIRVRAFSHASSTKGTVFTGASRQPRHSTLSEVLTHGF